MPKTRNSYVLTGASPELQRILQSIADRLDKLEGIRGDAQIEGAISITSDDGDIAGQTVVDLDGTTIHSME